MDSALEGRWITKAVDVYRYKRKEVFGAAIQELRHFKGLRQLDLQELEDMAYIYNIINFIQERKDITMSNYLPMHKIPIWTFIIRTRGPYDRDEDKWRRARNKFLMKVFQQAPEVEKGQEDFDSLQEAVKPKAYSQGWDMPKDYLELASTKCNMMKPEDAPKAQPVSVDQLFDLIGKEANKILRVRRRDFKNFSEEIEKQEYPELQSDKSNTSEEPESLNAPATAIIIRAINKVEPGSIDVSFDGVIKGVENFNIPYEGSPKNLYNYTQAGGSDKDPNRNGPLRAAEKWLFKQGYTEAGDIVKRWITED
jgi:hypothetical protein